MTMSQGDYFAEKSRFALSIFYGGSCDRRGGRTSPQGFSHPLTPHKKGEAKSLPKIGSRKDFAQQKIFGKRKGRHRGQAVAFATADNNSLALTMSQGDYFAEKRHMFYLFFYGGSCDRRGGRANPQGFSCPLTPHEKREGKKPSFFRVVEPRGFEPLTF